jgi:hypothetical protein
MSLFAALALSGCARNKMDNIELANDSIGLRITRTACPAAGVPAYTGDVTLFNPPSSRDARAIDVVAEISDVKANCTDSGSGPLVSSLSFRVDARRASGAGARDVTLPFFATAMRGGTAIVSKQLDSIALHFADGQLRASTSGAASITIDRAAVALPENVRDRLMRRRKAKDADASIDPMTDPEVRSSVSRASFELLVGFQLTNDQLAYNATR